MKMTKREREKTRKKIKEIADRFGMGDNERFAQLVLDAVEQKGTVLQVPNFHVPYRVMCEDCKAKVKDEYRKHLNRYKKKWIRKKKKMEESLPKE